MGTGLNILFPIALGGAVGALARYLASLGINSIAGIGFPYATLFVNVLGSFAIGVLYVVIIESPAGLTHYRAPLIVGLLGAFTTFSTFSIETIHLLEAGYLLKGCLNVLLNVVLCLAGCWGGLALAR